MTPEGIEARRAYYRKWAKEHRDKIKAAQTRYWEKRSRKMKIEESQEEPQNEQQG